MDAGREGGREGGKEHRHRIRQDDTVKQSEWQRNEKREIKANMVQEDGEQRGKLLGWSKREGRKGSWKKNEQRQQTTSEQDTA